MFGGCSHIVKNKIKNELCLQLRVSFLFDRFVNVKQALEEKNNELAK